MFYPKNMRGNVEPWVHLPAAAGEYKAGTFVTIGDSGYLCMADVTLEEGQLLPVQSVQLGQVYVSTLASDIDGLTIGARVGFDENSEVVATDGGMFAVEWFEGTAAGSEVHVRITVM